MKYNETLILLSAFALILPGAAISQEPLRSKYNLVGSCEGCEAVFEYGNSTLKSMDTLPDFHDKGQQIKISGIVYNPGGIEPASDVILYIYHTNQDGIYPTKGSEKGWERRHGYLRGWIKTNALGEYCFYTLRPEAYPSGTEPAHIHLTILEPDGAYYWLNSFYFADDPLLTDKEKSNESARGGSNGILYLHKKGKLLVAERNIELGKNIPGYE